MTDLPPRWWAGVVRRLVARPGLWGIAVVTGWRLAAPGWWRRWPPLPAPAPDYARFRLVTAYGDPPSTPPADDVLTYLAWCREQRRG